MLLEISEFACNPVCSSNQNQNSNRKPKPYRATKEKATGPAFLINNLTSRSVIAEIARPFRTSAMIEHVADKVVLYVLHT